MTDLSSGLRDLVDREFLVGKTHEGQHWRANRSGAHPSLLDFEKAFLRRMRAHGIPMFSHCIVRSDEDQRQAYVTGASKAKPGESAHNYGMATDLIHGTKGWDLADQSWAMVGHIGKEVAQSRGIKIVWGGDWGWDFAHWELKEWKSLKDAYPFAGLF